MKNLLSLLCAFLVSFCCLSNHPAFIQEGDNPSLHVDFDDCVSWFNGYNEDYSEFTALSSPVENCASLELAGPGYVYRNNSKENVHSCTPGIDSTSIGMCVSGLDNCEYIAGDSTSLIFEVRVIPGTNGMGSLEEISFYEKAPEMFDFYQGSSGTNNYPTKFGIRVHINGDEIYRQDNMDTQRDWNLRTFNLSDVEAFTVTDTTVFQFEILPYCLVGNNSPIHAWDIDNLTITAGCNNINAGFVKVIGNVNICQDDTLNHVLTLESEGAFGPNLAWLIFDGDGEIVSLPDTNIVDFDMMPNGIFTIYHLAYGDDFDGLALGNTLADLEGCFDLSSRIVIVNNKLEAGILETDSGENIVQICSDAAQENVIELTLEDEVGLQTNYFLLSDAQEIIDISLVPFFDLINIDAGNYTIIAITHNGQLINAAPGNTLDQIQGCFAISNSVFITKEFIDGGSINLETDVFCVGDGIPDLLEATVVDFTGLFTSFIVTNGDSVIIATPNLPLDLDDAAAGQCILWHVSALDSLTMNVDTHISEISGGCYDLSEAVPFTRIENNAGTVSIEGGDNEATICVSDSIADVIVFENTGSAAMIYQYIITDESNMVLEISDSDTLDFTNAPIGVCRVWGSAHDGSFDLEVGDTLTDSLEVGCISISARFVVITRVDGGPACGEFPCEVAGGFIDLFGNTYCVGDGIPDLVTGDVQSANGDFMQLVVTGPDSIIIDLPPALGFDVDGADPGMCIVWNVASTDSINLTMGMSINAIDNECFDVSTGAAFNRIENNGGEVSLEGGSTTIEICVGDTLSDALSFVTTGTGETYQYIVTDTFNVILDLPDSTVVDFENAPPGICRVWGLAHNGTFSQMVGEILNTSTTTGGCYSLSSGFITVVRLESGVECGDIPCNIDGGFIDLFSNNFCVGDGVPDFVTGDLQGEFGLIHQTIVTGPDSIIIDLPASLNFDVDGAPAGTCIVWNLATNDSIPLMLGMNISAIQGECFELSLGASFTRTANFAGTITLTAGAIADTVCVGDNIQNALAFIAQSALSDEYQFVITNEVNTILALPTNNSFNFDVLPPGICRVYGVAYSGTFLPEVGDSLSINPSTNGCFDITNNFVTILKEDCSTMTTSAGSISLLGGATEFCPGDTTATIINGGGFMKFGFSSDQDFRSIFETNLDDDAQPDYIFAQGDKFNWVEHDGVSTSLVTTPLTHDFAFNFGVSVVVDIDGDGDTDVITGAFASDEWDLFLLSNDGSNNFTATEIADGTWNDMSLNPVEVKVVDLENDGDLDIVAINNISNSLFDRKGVLYINDGSENFTTVNFDTGTPYSGLAVGHLDGNSDADIVVMKRVSQQDSLFLFSDVTTSNTKTLIDPNLSDSMFSDVDNITKLVDMDMDGDLDIVIFNSTMANYIYFNDGAGSFTKMDLNADIRVEPDTDIQDFDGDGDLDFTTIRGVQINDGSFNYSFVDYDFKLKNNRAHVLISDVDGDGQLDLLNGAGEWFDFESGGYSFEVNVTGGSAGESRWVLTDDQGVIVSILDQDPPLEYDLMPIGTYELYRLVYNGTITGLAVDENISGLAGDFDLSNIITLNSEPCVDECIVDAGFIDLFGSQYCVGDGEPDFVTGEVINAEGDVQQIIVTGLDSIIIQLPDTLNFDVDGALGGSCIVWNMASNDTIPLMVGMHIGTIQNDCFDLSTGASFTRIFNNGGEVSLVGGDTSIQICVGDSVADELSFATNGGGQTYQYIVTDTLNVILALPDSSVVDFESSPAGVCRVWGLATNSVFSGVVGDTLVEPEIAGRCFDLSTNFVTVERMDCGSSVNAGVVTLIDGTSEYCPGDSTGMQVFGDLTGHTFNLGLTGGIGVVDLDGDIYNDYILSSDKFLWAEYDPNTDEVILTDLATVSNGIVSFETVDIDSDGDFDIVYRNPLRELNLLINDGLQNFTEVLIDDDSNVLAVSSINPDDFDNDGDVDILMAARIPGSDDELRFYENDGSLNFTMSVIEVYDPIQDIAIADIDMNGEKDIVVTRSSNNTSSIFYNPLSSDVSAVLDSSVMGDARLLVLDYDSDGDLDITSTDNGGLRLFTNDGAQNFVETTLLTFLGGILYDVQDYDNDGDMDIIGDGGFYINNGDDTFVQAPFGVGMLHNIFSDVNGDGSLDGFFPGGWIENGSAGFSFDFNLAGATGDSTKWVLTNDQGDIVSIDDQDPPLVYDLMPLGTFGLYHIVFNGTITGLTVDENISGLAGDFDLSDIITLNSTPCEECIVDAGFIDLFGSQYCVGDGEPDFVTGEVINAEGDVQQIIVTGLDSIIIQLPDTLNFDVDGALGGSCIVWNMASNDTIPLVVGMHIGTIQNDCFDLSTGASFTRIFNNGGEVSLVGGDTSIQICVGDSVADELSFATTGGGQTYQYIVTDTLNVILALPDSSVVDFESSPAGVCRVWGLATNSVFSGVVGDTLVEPEIAGRCFDLSSNFVTVERFDTGGPCSTSNEPELTIVLNRVGESSQIFDIKNISNDTIDVSDYWLCRTGNLYTRIGAAYIECGSFSNLMAPGDIKGINLSLNNMDGELAIYTTNDFDNPDAMIHYVEWGSTGHARSDEAIAADLWSTGDFVESIAPNQSIYFSGAGYASDSWNEGISNVCGEFIVDASIVFSRVSDSGQVIDLENISQDTIDVNDYEIQQGSNSYRVGDLVVECGNGTRILNPGDKVGLVVIPMSNVAGELALYTSSANASFGPVTDYVQWGDAGFPNESRAVSSGIWTSGAFVPTFTSGQSIIYDGDGDEVTDWTEGATTFCGSPAPNSPQRIDARISPNPAVDLVTIKIMKAERTITKMQIIDGNGKVYMSTNMEMNTNDIYQMSINDLASGIYFLRMTSQNAVVTERFMVVK